MKIEVTGRQGFTPTKAIKDYAEKRLSKVLDFFGHDVIHEVRVVGKVYKQDHIIEVTIPAKGTTLRAEVKDPDMYVAIDKVTDKLVAQIRKK